VLISDAASPAREAWAPLPGGGGLVNATRAQHRRLHPARV
jgi:hypothetical protein